MSTIAVKLLFADVKLLQFALMPLDYPLLENLQRNLLIIFEIWYIFFKSNFHLAHVCTECCLLTTATALVKISSSFDIFDSDCVMNCVNIAFKCDYTCNYNDK